MFQVGLAAKVSLVLLIRKSAKIYPIVWKKVPYWYGLSIAP